MLKTVIPALGFGIAVLLSTIGHAAGPAAIVTDLRGDVRAGSGGRIDLLAELPAGAELVLPAEASLTVVHLGSQSTYALNGPGAFAIRAGGVEGRGGAKVATAKALSASYQGVRLQPARIAQASIAMRGDAADERLRLISPVATWVLETQPKLHWASRTGAAEYRVQITDSDNRLLFEFVTRDTSANLPAHLVLEPGRLYGWQVRASLPDGRGLEAWAEFGIADQTLRSRIDAARPNADATTSERVLFALLLESLNAHDAARAEWGQIARERPQEARLRAFADR